MLAQCEMIELHITNKKCSERTHILTDWCHICRIREVEL
jgi:hypothetical protein